jgi:large subunit ribosomal protein L9
MATMRVILSEEVPNLGDAGDVVTVKAGFGRNYLLPQGKALLATAGRVKEIEHKRRVIEEKEKKEVNRLGSVGDRLAAVDLSFSMFASAEGRLFGSVTNADIAARFAEQGVPIERRKIQLREPIKQIGSHEITVRLHREVIRALSVTVVSAGAPPEEPEAEIEAEEGTAEAADEDSED